MEAAAREVRTGSWTDDRRAATFLGGPDAPGPPSESSYGTGPAARGSTRKVEAATAEKRRLQRGEHA